MSRRLNEVLERLSEIPNLGTFADIIDLVRSIYDVDHVYYYAMSLGVDSKERKNRSIETTVNGGVLLQVGRKMAAVSYTPDWMARYLEARFDNFDPVLHGACANFDPIDWSELDWEGANKQLIREEAADFGVGNQGYTIPIRGPNGQFAIFTINKRCDATTWQRLLGGCRNDIILLAHFTHQRMLQLAGLEHAHANRPLSVRERDAMRLISHGLSRGKASEKLGISENTFRVYVDSARHKLGALNIPHAIALAAHRGLIPPA